MTDLKDFLIKLNENLDALQVQAANYGSVVGQLKQDFTGRLKQ